MPLPATIVAYSYRRDPAVPAFADDRPIIVFDGLCVICSGWAGFVLRHDRQGLYRLVTAQSPLGQALFAHYGLDVRDYETNILLADGRAWFKSEGSIRMAEGLGMPYALAGVLRLVPRVVRDFLYDRLAHNRLKLFGARDTCYAPDAEMRSRFLS